MGGEQIAVVALILAAFLAGWFVRGVRPGPGEEPPEREGLLTEADRLLERAVEASRAALDSPAASGPSLGELRASLAELERIDGRVETVLGAGTPAYESFETALNELTALARGLAVRDRIDAGGEAALEARAGAARSARSEYERRMP